MIYDMTFFINSIPTPSWISTARPDRRPGQRRARGLPWLARLRRLARGQRAEGRAREAGAAGLAGPEGHPWSGRAGGLPGAQGQRRRAAGAGSKEPWRFRGQGVSRISWWVLPFCFCLCCVEKEVGSLHLNLLTNPPSILSRPDEAMHGWMQCVKFSDHRSF